MCTLPYTKLKKRKIIPVSWSIEQLHSECHQHQMGRDARKPVFGVSDRASLKVVSSATEISLKNEISLVASLDMILLKKRTTKALIRLRGCAGWSAPLLFANPRRQVFSRRGPNNFLPYPIIYTRMRFSLGLTICESRGFFFVSSYVC